MSNLSSVEMVTITAAVAEKYLKENQYEFQRKTRMAHVEEIKDELLESSFLEGKDVVFGHLNGEAFMVDGYHLSAAIKESKIPITATVKRYFCKNKRDLAELYFKLDIGVPRSIRDAIRSLLLVEKFKVSEKSLSAIITGAAYLLKFASNYNGFRRVSNPERVRLAEQWGYIGAKYFNAVLNRGPDSTIWFRAPVAAYALHTFKKHPDSCLSFWHAMAVNDGLKIGDPRRTLSDWMRKHGIGGGQSANADTRSRNVHFKAIDLAWSAYLEGRDITKIKISPETIREVSLK